MTINDVENTTPIFKIKVIYKCILNILRLKSKARKKNFHAHKINKHNDIVTIIVASKMMKIKTKKHVGVGFALLDLRKPLGSV